MNKNEFYIEFPLKISELLDFPINITWRGEDEEKNKKIKINLLDTISNENEEDKNTEKLKKWSVEVIDNNETLFKSEIEYIKTENKESWSIKNVKENKIKLDTDDISNVALYLNEETYLKKGFYNNILKTKKMKI